MIPEKTLDKDKETVKLPGYFLKPGFIYLPRVPTVISAVLGSCVSVCLFDEKMKTGGMNHFRMPKSPCKEKSTAIYGDVATKTLIRMMLGHGSKMKNLEAQIIGGAMNHKLTSVDIGSENIHIATSILRKAGVRIVSEDSGGTKGRKIIFDTSTNTTAVIKVDRLRLADWYPYNEER